MKYGSWIPRKKKREPISVDELLKRADEYDSRWMDVVVHSLDLYDEDRRFSLVKKFLSRKNRWDFNAVNTHSKKIWLAELVQEFLRVHRKDGDRSWREALENDVACALVTLTHEGWCCSDQNIQIDLGRMKQKIRNALIGTNYIARIEAAPYSNESWETNGVEGRLICFHAHAIVWSRSRTSLDRLRTHIKPRFQGILGNSDGAHFAALEGEHDVTRALVYSAKMPLSGKQTMVKSNGKKVQRTSRRIAFKTHEHLFHALKDHALWDFWLAGGKQATEALRAVRNKLKEQQRCNQLIPNSL